MNDRTLRVYAKYVRTLADKLLLQDWEIILLREPAPDGTLADVCIFDTENYAKIRLHPDYFQCGPSEQREYLVHELVHLHMDRPQRIVNQLAELWNENSATLFARMAHDKEIEVCVQRFARILAPTLPLPPS